MVRTPYRFLVLILTVVLSGCANQLPQRSEHELRTERVLLDQNLQIEAASERPMQIAQRRISIYEEQLFDVTEYKVVRVYDRYTPYQAWRKLYEIPAGAVAVVAGVAANLANIVAFGSIPKTATHDWLAYGIDGLNPFMNVVSNGRAEQNLASIHEQKIDQRTEQVRLPWADQLVTIRAGKRTHELQTDPRGILSLNLLEGSLAEQDLSYTPKLLIRVVDPRTTTTKQTTVTLTPELRTKLREAHQLIFSNLEADDVSQWVYRVNRLVALGFEEEANELEKSLIELTANDPELQKSFLTALHPAQ